MKIKSLFAFLFIPFLGFSQFTETFSDFNLSENPTWQGDTNFFTFETSAQDTFLQSDFSTSQNTASLFTTNTQTVSRWTFRIKLNFSPSSSNAIRVYLFSDTSNLEEVTKGYYLRIGENGSDDGLDFYKQNADQHTLLFDDTIGGLATNPDVIVEVSRDERGNWLLKADKTQSDTLLTLACFQDSSFQSTCFFGFLMNYTSTRANDFSLDDISITEPEDFSPPYVENFEILNGNSLKLIFNESVDTSTLFNLENYMLNSDFKPSTVFRLASDELQLTFNTDFIFGTNNLIVKSLSDTLNNNLKSPIIFNFEVVDNSSPRLDSLKTLENNKIRLFFSKVLDSLSLLSPENIRLKNEDINLLSFSLEANGLLLCFNRNLELNKKYTLIVDHFSDLLGNSNEAVAEKDFIFFDNQAPQALTISVTTPYGIHILFSESIDYELTETESQIYLPDLGNIGLVQKGKNVGELDVSFDKLLPENVPIALQIYGISDDFGNRSDTQNIIFTYDTRKPTLENFELIDSKSLKLTFSEILEQNTASAYNHYIFLPNVNIENIDYKLDTIILFFTQALLPEINYTLNIKNIRDLGGNQLTTTSRKIYFDDQVPILQDIKILYGKKIELLFSESIDTTLAKNENNYNLEPIGKPDSIGLANGNKKLILYYESGFFAHDTLKLFILQLSDLQGNNIQDTLKIPIDLTSPKISQLYLSDKKNLTLIFSEFILQNIDIENFNCPNNQINALVFQDSSIVRLSFDEIFESDRMYTLNTAQIIDTKGFISNDLNDTFQVINHLESIATPSLQSLELRFEKNINSESLNINLFQLNQSIFPNRLGYFSDFPNKVILFFDSIIQANQTHRLHIGNLIFENWDIQTSDNHLFELDTKAPEILKAFYSQNQITLFFDETLDKIKAEIINNYQLNDNLLPTNSLNSDNVVYLTYNFDFQLDSVYILTLENIEDLSGNVLLPTSIKVKPLPVISKNDLLLTEIMANPSGNNYLKYEYIELYNNSQDTLELLGLHFSDLTTTVFLPEYELLPQSYVTLTKEGTNSNYYKNLNINTLPVINFPTLNNSGDLLSLYNTNNSLIFEVNYKDTWYQDENKKNSGYSLEHIGFQAFCHSESNWLASSHENGGTPSALNITLQQDTSPPQLNNIKYLDDNGVVLYFNERVDTSKIINIQGVDIFEFVLAPDSLSLFFQNPLEEGQMHNLVIHNISDCVGNTANLNTALLNNSPIQSGDLIISEMMIDPTPKILFEDFEYLELYNRSNLSINLLDYQLVVNNSVLDLPNYILPAKTYLLLSDLEGAAYFDNFTLALGIQNLPSLPNTGAFVALQKKDGTPLFYVNYNINFYQDNDKKDGGYSLEMIDLESFCLEYDNWMASEAREGGTPGKENSLLKYAPLLDQQKPTILDIFAFSESQLYVICSEKLDPQTLSSANYQFNQNLTIDSIIFDYKNPNAFVINLKETLQPDIFYELGLSNFADCSGNFNLEKSVFSFRLPEEAEQGDIIFNEILFQASTPVPEFIEFYNRSDKYIDMSPFKIANLDNGEFTNIRNLISVPYILKPKSYLVITEDKIFLEIEYAIANKASVIETGLPRLSNEGDNLILLNADNEGMDSLEYSSDWHLTFLQETKNVSLERIDFEAESNNKNNWQSAAGSVGYATPSRPNSHLNSFAQLAQNCFSIEPPIFTPDFDGVNDFMLFSYNCQAQNNILNIDIYSFSGLLVKTLVQNYYIDNKGFIKWDGTDNNGQVVGIGHYIFDIKVFDNQGNRTKMRKTVVVGGKF